MAEEKPDVTAEAQGLNDAEQYLKDLPLRKDAEQQALVEILYNVDAALRGLKVQHSIALALDKKQEVTQILENTRDLLKRRKAIQSKLEG